MPKAFFTERDIEDLCERGVTSLEINDDVVLTELAREKARLSGLTLVRRKPGAGDASPVAVLPADPVREPESKLQQRIRSAVLAKLGDQLDPALVDKIIRRVLSATGVK
jgi:hypothetical protein